MNMPVRQVVTTQTKMAITLLSLAIGTSFALELPTGKHIGPVQFDAIVELSNPRIREHSTLFARYWVTADEITFGIIWAEPHTPAIYFPLYPVTFTMRTNKERFQVNSQTDPLTNAAFPKPTAARPMFRHMFGDYPVTNLRFAEQEGLAARVYRQDFSGICSTTAANGLHPIDLSHRNDSVPVNGRPTSAQAYLSSGCLQRLTILDREQQQLRNIEYDYAWDKGRPHLRQQRVSLPETKILVGLNSGSITVTTNDNKEYTYTEFQSTYHDGGRECVIDYQYARIGDESAVMPTCISVRRADSGILLRKARLLDLRPLDCEPHQIGRMAQEAAHFGAEDLDCRKLVVKYWQAPLDAVADQDKEQLVALATHFGNRKGKTKGIGEEIRRLSFLMQIAWVLGNTQELVSHFQAYLNALASHDLDKTLMLGGRHIIETTILWQNLRAADALLEIWVNVIASRNDCRSILPFAFEELAGRRFWPLVKLLDGTVQQYQGAPEIAFQAHCIRCLALCELQRQFNEPETLKREIDIMQIGWVSQSMSATALSDEAQASYNLAKDAFQSIANPNQVQLNLRIGIEAATEDLRRTE